MSTVICTAIHDSTSLAAYLGLFAGIGFIFVAFNLFLGWLLRPSDPHAEKLEIYECGEPTIGSSFVQFDLRFYVVALIFIVFDVEVAFLFPWATVFGKAETLARMPVAEVASADDGTVANLLTELGVRTADGSPMVLESLTAVQQGAQELLWLATIEILVFFVILLIAFACEWKLGALDWVRAITDEYRERAASEAADQPSTTVLSA